MKKVFVLLALGTTMVACGPSTVEELNKEWKKECTSEEKIVSAVGKDKVDGFCDCVFDKLKADANNEFDKLKASFEDKDKLGKVTLTCMFGGK